MDHIDVNWALCDGNAACVLEAPDYFAIDDDDDLQVLEHDVTPGDEAVVARAVSACPKHALVLGRRV